MIFRPFFRTILSARRRAGKHQDAGQQLPAFSEVDSLHCASFHLNSPRKGFAGHLVPTCRMWSTLFFMRLRLVLVVFGVFFSLVLQWQRILPRASFSPPSMAWRLIRGMSTRFATKQPRGNSGKPTPVLAFQEGKLAFFQSFEGRITGFVFSGIGPRGRVASRTRWKKQQVARFPRGRQLLDEQFSFRLRAIHGTARIRDSSARTGARGFNRPPLTKSSPALWGTNLDRLNPSHSLRILIEKYSNPHSALFSTPGIDGVLTGPLDILLDEMQYNDFNLGQPRTVGKATYYDVLEFCTGCPARPPFFHGDRHHPLHH